MSPPGQESSIYLTANGRPLSATLRIRHGGPTFLAEADQQYAVINGRGAAQERPHVDDAATVKLKQGIGLYGSVLTRPPGLT